MGKIEGKNEKFLMEKWTELEKIIKGRFLSGEDMLFTHPTFDQYCGSRFIWSKKNINDKIFTSAGVKMVQFEWIRFYSLLIGVYSPGF